MASFIHTLRQTTQRIIVGEAAVIEIVNLSDRQFVCIPEPSDWYSECELILSVLYLTLTIPIHLPWYTAKCILTKFEKRWLGDTILTLDDWLVCIKPEWRCLCLNTLLLLHTNLCLEPWDIREVLRECYDSVTSRCDRATSRCDSVTSRYDRVASRSDRWFPDGTPPPSWLVNAIGSGSLGSGNTDINGTVLPELLELLKVSAVRLRQANYIYIGNDCSEGLKINPKTGIGEHTNQGRDIGVHTNQGRDIGVHTNQRRDIGEHTNQGRDIGVHTNQGRDIGVHTNQRRDIGVHTNQRRDIGEHTNQGRDIGEHTNQGRDIGEHTNQGRDIGEHTNQGRDIGEHTNQGRDIGVHTNQSYVSCMSRFLEANTLYKAGQYGVCLSILTTLDTQHHHYAAPVLQGWVAWVSGLCLVRVGHPHTALVKLREAVNGCVSCVSAVYNISQIYQQRGNVNAELETLELITQAVTDNNKKKKSEGVMTLHEALLLHHHTPVTQLSQRAVCMLALRCLQSKMYVQAVQYFTQLLNQMENEITIITTTERDTQQQQQQHMKSQQEEEEEGESWTMTGRVVKHPPKKSRLEGVCVYMRVEYKAR
ncbi:hypothetical protein Pmani_017692 [Petrolisthes manimaculis]|uniref:Uncharacterized protein n=1 Tax=Petrolisthes manimaculis TaxID=1843537 RepID=A0AAE1PP84_9EUCA|nr:hypothetical protein Pmani_017692 [Petrolisthes manimaculis]